jgi:DNA-binding transcriptional ArsR family regulator/uncharacterized protein YndB with AHSA1/START domain
MISMSRDESVWAALADPTRRKVLDLLKSGPQTTGQLCGRFDLSRTAVMKHLDVLEQARLILVRRSGRERWNYINAAPLRRIYERWMTPFQQLWAASLSKLATISEGATLVDTSNALSLTSVEHEAEIQASPARVFEALTLNIASWWSHCTYDAPGKPDLRLETSVGGRFYESSDDKQRLYATVTRYEPPSKLWLQGPMGMSGCVFGTITFDLQSKDANVTIVRLSHTVMGQIDEETASMYRGGWKSLIDDGLKSYVERGTEVWAVA